MLMRTRGQRHGELSGVLIREVRDRDKVAGNKVKDTARVRGC